MATRLFARLGSSEFNQALWKALPVVNFGIATLALTFQTTVLYPWHLKLEEDFDELKHEHESQLDKYHKMKLEKLDAIEHKLNSIHVVPVPSSTNQ